MSFQVDAASYDRFMGRYSTKLSPLLADFAGVAGDMSVLDVGCGPGALTGELVRRVGPSRVVAVDPSAPFVAAVKERYPDVHAELASVEHLPFPDRSFDVVCAQLVVHFLKDPVAGVGEMRRVSRRRVAGCVWDHAGGTGPLEVFWEAARQVEGGVEDQSHLPGTRQGHLEEIFADAGLTDVEGLPLTVTVEHSTFEEWWEPFALGVGPAGAHVARLTPTGQAELRDRCRQLLPDAPFEITATAWAARGRA